MKRSPWIIDVGDRRHSWYRYRDWILSVAMWIVFIYLIKDVFIDLYSLASESFKWAFLQAPLPSVPRVFRFLYTLGLYSIVVVVNGFILVGWASYNRYRFRGSDNRRAIGAVSVEQLGQFYGLPGEIVAEWQQARSLVMIHDFEGNLISVLPNPWGMTKQPPVRETMGTAKKTVSG